MHTNNRAIRFQLLSVSRKMRCGRWYSGLSSLTRLYHAML